MKMKNNWRQVLSWNTSFENPNSLAPVLTQVLQFCKNEGIKCEIVADPYVPTRQAVLMMLSEKQVLLTYSGGVITLKQPKWTTFAEIEGDHPDFFKRLYVLLDETEDREWNDAVL